MTYEATRSRVETYFDQTATRTWERLTSDAPVSKIRATVREGRDKMRALMLSRMPEDLRGARILDAGCGAGQMTEELAKRGAHVVATDISPSLVEIAQRRLPDALSRNVAFRTTDMLSDTLGDFDHVVAMDSLIYYTTKDIHTALETLGRRTNGSIVFTVAPKTMLLMTMWRMGKLFPRSDRSPAMIPHNATALSEVISDIGRLARIGRISNGFYISEALEFRR